MNLDPTGDWNMQTFKNTNNTLQIDFDRTDLKEHQVRVIKTINTLLTQLIATDSEEEFFEATSEIMRNIACAVKQSNFTVSQATNILSTLNKHLNTLSIL